MSLRIWASAVMKQSSRFARRTARCDANASRLPRHASGHARNEKGFTFVEILMTLTVIAVLFVPVMQLFSHSIYATTDSLDLITATNLAKSEMERTLNMNKTKAQLREMGDQLFPLEAEPPMEVNHTQWRVYREFIQGSDPLEVRVHVYRDKEPKKDVVMLVTLIEDMMWESIKAVSPT